MHVFRKLILLIFAGAISFAPCAAVAAEPVEEFLDALVAARYHDMAVEYLARIEKTGTVDQAFRDELPFRMGKLLVEGAAFIHDPVLRERQLDQGQAKLKEFVAQHPGHAQAPAANSLLANVLVERGRSLAGKAERSSDKAVLRGEARALLDEAAKIFETTEKGLVEQYSKLTDETAQDADTEPKKEQLASDILEKRLLIGLVGYERSKTFDAGSAEAKKELEESAKKFAEIYSRYGDRAAAFFARYYEARNYFELGDTDKALNAVLDVIALDAKNQEARPLLAKGFALAAKCWIKKDDFKTAIERAAAFASDARGNEFRDPDWLELRYLVAVAYERQSARLKEGDSNKAKYLTEARRLAADVAKYRGDQQGEARALLAKLGRPMEENAPAETGTFADALEKTQTALEDYTTAKEAYETARASKDNPETENLKTQLAERRSAALASVKQAMELTHTAGDVSKVNRVRFFLCYLHWELAQAESEEKNSSSHYYDAAVLGDFLARRYPTDGNARQASAITMAAYQKIRQEIADEVRRAAEADKKTAEETRKLVDEAVLSWSQKIAELAAYAVAKWPDTDQANDAMAILASVEVERENYEKAIELVGRLKPQSRSRIETELRIGRAIWANYTRLKKSVDASAKPANGDAAQATASNAGAPTADTLAAWARQAQGLLESALNVVKEKELPIDRDVALGVWALVQSYVNTSQPEKAIPWLTDAKLGLITLVDQKHEVTEIEGLTFDAYRLALRAYVSVKPQQLDKALATMDALEKVTGSDAKGMEQLTSIYIAMGRDLQEQLKDLAQTGLAGEVQDLSTAFEAFLERLAERESGATFNSLFWVADTYSELGAGLLQSAKKSPADKLRAEEFYNQAIKTFEKLLERAKADPKFMPEKYKTLVQVRLAKAYRGAGRHNEALKLLVAVLKEKPTALDVQFEAAYTYQEFADTDPTRRGNFYRYAIIGGQTGDHRNIWGWVGLQNRVGRSPQYKDKYQEVRYNIAYCHYGLALAETDGEEKAKMLQLAKKDIWNTYTLIDPEFGGGQWKPKNEKLLKTIQTALDEPAEGFKAFQERKATLPTPDAAASK